MRRKSLFWQIYPSYVWILILSLSAILAFAFVSFGKLFREQTISSLEARAQLLRDPIIELLKKGDFDAVDVSAKQRGSLTTTRITVILPDGRVVGDSSLPVAGRARELDLQEFHDAFASGRGVSQREDSLVKKEMIFFALPLKDGEKVLGALRVGTPADFYTRAFLRIYLEVLGTCIVLVAFVAMVAWFYTQRISRPLEEMRDQADQIARGEISGVAPTSMTVAGEIEGLGQSINQLAFQLNSRMQTILQQRNEEEAMLSSMVEGVIAVDARRRILNINEAAAEFLGLSRGSVLSKTIEEVVRIPKMQKLILRVLEGESSVEEEVTFGETDRVWQVHGNSLRGADGANIGALIVFSDVSRMRELESHRRDFVANVSHELRTPLTSIKGFLETLRDGAIDDPGENRRFLEIALKHTDRLNAIIEDLLRLSRLEKDTEGADIPLHSGVLRDVLEEAIELCEVKSKPKNVSLKLECPMALTAQINPPLLEQAVVNLIDNAIKFSEEGGTVTVRGRQDGDEVIISVADRGPGIAPEHLSRIFERFYRVDKARSRNLGGTGLGLAIVKHVALAHRGQADVKSEVGRGSEFSLRLRA